MVEDLVLNK